MIFGRDGGSITIDAKLNAELLVFNGNPINEPVVAHGPFARNTVREIKRAMLDFQNSKLGIIREAGTRRD